MTPSDMQPLILKHSQASELYHVTTFEGYRRNAEGHDRKIRVKVMDRGGGFASGRYHVVAEDEDGRHATGNPDDNLDIVLLTLHWGDLNKPPVEDIQETW